MPRILLWICLSLAFVSLVAPAASADPDPVSALQDGTLCATVDPSTVPPDVHYEECAAPLP